MDYGDEHTKEHGAKVIEAQLENIKNDLVKEKSQSLYCTKWKTGNEISVSN